MTDISPERLRELAAEIVLDHARDIEYLSVSEMLEHEVDIDEIGEAEYDRIARQVHDLATTASLTVEWPADGEPIEVERLRAYVDERDDTIGSIRADLDLQTKAAFDNQAEAARLRDDYECAHADRLARTLERDRTIDEREHLKGELARLTAERSALYALAVEAGRQRDALVDLATKRPVGWLKDVYSLPPLDRTPLFGDVSTEAGA